MFFYPLPGADAASDFYCTNPSDQSITGVTSGRIITRNPTATYYDNNMHCSWHVRATGADQIIVVDVVESNLHWSPSGAICVGYDYVEVRDGEL
jgi:hypothetical protein